jgi:hypothetical protein
MRPVSLCAVSVAGKIVGSLCSLDLRCVACGFNEMPALCARVFGGLRHPQTSHLASQTAASSAPRRELVHPLGDAPPGQQASSLLSPVPATAYIPT